MYSILMPLALIAELLTVAWWFATTVAIAYGMTYLGGVLFGTDVPETEAGPAADSQSRMWYPHTTQQEGIARPRAYGRNLHHGNIVAKWCDVVDDREVLYLMIEHGDGPTKGVVYNDGVPEIYLNDQPVTNFTNVEVQERLGTLNQTCMTGFEKTKLGYPQDTQLIKDTPIIVTTPNDHFDDIEYTIMFPLGLLKYQKDGDRKTSVCQIKVRIREHPDGGWTTIFNAGISASSTEAVFKLYKVNTLSPGYVSRGTQYDVEFTNLTGPGNRHVNDVYLRSFREVVDVAFTRPGKALIGIRAVATEALSGRLDVKVVREDKLIRVWNGSVWTIEYSRNRAWVAWDALTQPVISGDGNGGGPFTIESYEGCDPAHLDLEFFYQWAEFCSVQVPDGYGGTEDRIACDTILDFQTDVWKFVNEIANVGRAHLYWQGHFLTGWIDKAETTITDLVTMDNVMARSWKNAWTEKDALAGKVEVFFQDSRQGYERTSAPLPNESAGRYTKIISIEGIGITTRGTAIHLANHALKRNQLIRNVNKFRQYKDAFRYHLGDVIRLQNRIPDWGVGYRVIESTAANKVTLDRTCTADYGDTLYVRSYDTVLKIVVTDDYVVDSVVDKVVTITTNWDVTPTKNNLCAIGPAGSIKLRRITEIQSSVTNFFDVTVETYDSALFTADDLVPDNPDQNYIWSQPANPLIRPVTRAEVAEMIHQLVPPQVDADAPVTSNCTWTGSGGDTVTWSKTDATEPIIFRYKGTSYEITPDSTTDEFIYWDPEFTTTFRHTNDAAVAVALGKWYMCRNVDGVAYPTVPFSSVHAGVLQAGTITASLGQLANLVVTTGKIADLAVETLKIKDDAVTVPASAWTAGNIVCFAAWTTVQTLEFTTTGAPLVVSFALTGAPGTGMRLHCRLRRDTTDLVSFGPVALWPDTFQPITFDKADEPGAGTYTYTVQCKEAVGGNYSNVANRILHIIETKK